MSDQTNQDDKTNAAVADTEKTSPSDAPVEKKSARDEKGLTLGGRTMLRVYMEFNRIVIAGMRTNQTLTIDDILTQVTMSTEILDLMTIASGMGEKIGTPLDVNKYLDEHREEDRASLNSLLGDMQQKYGSKSPSNLEQMLGRVLRRVGADKCEICGNHKCSDCNDCHSCAERKGTPLN